MEYKYINTSNMITQYILSHRLKTIIISFKIASITFSIDGRVYGVTTPGSGGFWKLGDFSGNDNPWKNDCHMAPFDKEVTFFTNKQNMWRCGVFVIIIFQ